MLHHEKKMNTKRSAKKKEQNVTAGRKKRKHSKRASNQPYPVTVEGKTKEKPKSQKKNQRKRKTRHNELLYTNKLHNLGPLRNIFLVVVKFSLFLDHYTSGLRESANRLSKH